MKRIIVIATAIGALALAGSAAAALTPWIYDPTNTGCPTSSFSNGTLHLAKNCATATNASAGATITGVNGQTFTSGSFTLANASQCQGGSPRFNITTTTGTTYFLGCNNVTPTTNADGTVTYTFTAATIAAGGNQVTFPSGTITAADIVLDVQGSADLTNITVNGQTQVPKPTTGGGHGGAKDKCKNGGWKTFTSPKFTNQGKCVSYFAHQENEPRHAEAKADAKAKAEHESDEHSSSSTDGHNS